MFQNPIPSHPFQRLPSPEVSPTQPKRSRLRSGDLASPAGTRPSPPQPGIRRPGTRGHSSLPPCHPYFYVREYRGPRERSGSAKRSSSRRTRHPADGRFGGPLGAAPGRPLLLALRSVGSTAQPPGAQAACEAPRGANRPHPTVSSGEPRGTAALRQEPQPPRLAPRALAEPRRGTSRTDTCG